MFLDSDGTSDHERYQGPWRNAGKYKRERKAAIRAVVWEIYSPLRVTAAVKLLPELRMIPGFALDLTVVDSDCRLWDFDDVVMRDRARKRLLDERPMLPVESPMCTALSTWQRISSKIQVPVIVVGELKRALQFRHRLLRGASREFR